MMTDHCISEEKRLGLLTFGMNASMFLEWKGSVSSVSDSLRL